MDHRVLIPSNNANGSQRSYDQTCTKQPPATTRHTECTRITQESDPTSSINTLEIVRCNDTLQTALRSCAILKFKSYQTKIEQLLPAKS